MKTVSSISSNKNESPKTPGGISKSHLTPYRRVGLSRNYKRQGISPFISPLISNREVNSTKEEVVKSQQLEKKPAKEIVTAVSSQCTTSSDFTSIDGDQTPTRDLEGSRKKSKTLKNVINKSPEHMQTEDVEIKELEPVTTTPVRSNSKSKKKSLVKSLSIVSKQISQDISDIDLKDKALECVEITKNKEEPAVIQPKIPNDLAKECIVVIQKKIFKNDLKKLEKCKDKAIATITNEEKPNSQVFFDSDSDNEPFTKKTKCESTPNSEEEDFLPTNIITKSNSKCIKNARVKSEQPAAEVFKTNVLKLKEKREEKQSQYSLDDDDDFEVDNKRTILIRKSYGKVKKPLKAKSTGSITQKDIDDLKHRIELKKKILLKKTMTEDTKELRDLIKKWQKACQEALMQLMDLMNAKMSDNKNMDYSEMLKMLNIPPTLVGYDEDNECFNTPDDTNIILANI